MNGDSSTSSPSCSWLASSSSTCSWVSSWRTSTGAGRSRRRRRGRPRPSSEPRRSRRDDGVSSSVLTEAPAFQTISSLVNVPTSLHLSVDVMIKTSDFIAKCWLDHCRLNFSPSNSSSSFILEESLTSFLVLYKLYLSLYKAFRKILTFKILLRNRWTWRYHCRYVSRNTKQVASYVFYQQKQSHTIQTQDVFLQLQTINICPEGILRQ